MSSTSKKAKAKKANKDKEGKSEKVKLDIIIDYPIFDLKYLHKDYSLKAIKNDDKVSLINQLHLLSQFSWQDIIKAPRHGMGTEKIAKNAINPSMSSCVVNIYFFINKK